MMSRFVPTGPMDFERPLVGDRPDQHPPGEGPPRGTDRTSAHDRHRFPPPRRVPVTRARVRTARPSLWKPQPDSAAALEAGEEGTLRLLSGGPVEGLDVAAVFLGHVEWTLNGCATTPTSPILMPSRGGRPTGGAGGVLGARTAGSSSWSRRRTGWWRPRTGLASCGCRRSVACCRAGTGSCGRRTARPASGTRSSRAWSTAPTSGPYPTCPLPRAGGGSPRQRITCRRRRSPRPLPPSLLPAGTPVRCPRGGDHRLRTVRGAAPAPTGPFPVGVARRRTARVGVRGPGRRAGRFSGWLEPDGIKNSGAIGPQVTVTF